MKKHYFISDLHLGAPDYESSLVREKAFVQWLDAVAEDAAAIYIVGDLFDFWFEYKRAVPRGFVRALGKLAELADRGIVLHIFTGNHDMWIFDYLPKELGATLHRAPVRHELCGKKFFIGHGDGLGPGDYGYKFLKRVFANPLMQWCFERLHPNFGIWLADRSSKGSRKKTGDKDAVFLGAENEWLAIYARELQLQQPVDYYVFGHRHLPLEIPIEHGARYINLGDWIQHFTYGVFDGEEMQLKKWR
jgi:UDP-2,3-diacylglucosamine hydrolase